MNYEHNLYENSYIIDALEQVMWDVSDEHLIEAIQSQAQLLSRTDLYTTDIH